MVCRVQENQVLVEVIECNLSGFYLRIRWLEVQVLLGARRHRVGSARSSCYAIHCVAVRRGGTTSFEGEEDGC